MPTVIAAEGLSKAYGPTKALVGVDFHVDQGRVCALMGRNGAGKSTLVRILAGLERSDAGTVRLHGEAVAFRDPDHALRSGVATVHQEISIIPGLSVAENVALGRWESRGGLIDRRRTRELAQRALAILGVDLPLDTPAGDLRLAEQQLVEIARALSYEPKLLILDEPTSSLTESEADRLLEVVRNLAAQGVAVLYVSHRMSEIERVADDITVFRDGRLVAQRRIEEVTVREIATLMAGAEVEERVCRAGSARPGTPALRVHELHTNDKLRGIDLEVASGEIVGLAGRLGAGRTELLRAIAGLDATSGGHVEIAGARRFARSRDVRRRLAAGMALLPEDRKGQGIVLNQPIRHNMVLSCLRSICRLGFLDHRAERRLSEESRATTEIRAGSLDDPVSSLSGGNQQKVVLARCINAGVRVLLLDEPTRGVDIQSKHQIYDLIASLADEGCAVLLVSSEYGELLQNCDRILVVDDGTITGEVDPATPLDRLLAAIMRPRANERQLAS
jgi:sugar transport system ATP-binding protein